MIDNAIEYQCINCLCSLTLKPFNPADIGNNPPKMRCPICQHISIPKDQLDAHRNDRGLIDRQSVYKRWSNCPNAYKCSLHDQYDTDCEEGRMMPKCLVAVHLEAECATHFAQAAAQPKPRRQSGKAPGKNATDSE